MPGTIEFPLLPEDAITLGPRLAVIETPEELVFMNASGPLMSCSRSDTTAKRYLGAVLMTQGLVKGEDLAPVLGVHRSTLFRNQKLYREGGLDAIRDDRGHGAPRRAHKLTDEVLPIAQACLDQGRSQSAAAREVHVSETAIRHAIKTGRLRRSRRPGQRRAALSPGHRAERDAVEARGAGTAVKRLAERLLACQGELARSGPALRACGRRGERGRPARLTGGDRRGSVAQRRARLHAAQGRVLRSAVDPACAWS